MEFDGWMNYTYTLTPKKDLTVKDVRLEIAMKNEVASYFLGAGLPDRTCRKPTKANGTHRRRP